MLEILVISEVIGDLVFLRNKALKSVYFGICEHNLAL